MAVRQTRAQSPGWTITRGRSVFFRGETYGPGQEAALRPLLDDATLTRLVALGVIGLSGEPPTAPAPAREPTARTAAPATAESAGAEPVGTEPGAALEELSEGEVVELLELVDDPLEVRQLMAADPRPALRRHYEHRLAAIEVERTAVRE